MVTQLRGLVRRDERGTAAMEFALTLLPLMAILIGTIDFGRFAYHAITVTNAARAGASFCNYFQNVSDCNPTSNATLEGLIEQKVIDEATPYLTITSAQIDVTSPACGDPSATCLKVRVTYPFTTLFPIPRPDAGGAWVWSNESMTIVRSAQMRVAVSN